VLVEYIKNDLFPKAKFVLGKDEWDVGGTIYNGITLNAAMGELGCKAKLFLLY
jgi:hypothetical protein